jgi:hypothetical protein
MKCIIALLAIFLTSNLGLCQEAELKSTKAKAAVRDYERKIEDVDEDFEKQLKNLEKSYQMKSEILRARLLSNLNAAMEEEAKRVRLEEATEIKELIKQRKESVLPTLDELMGRSKGKQKKDKRRIPAKALTFNGNRYVFNFEPQSWHSASSYASSLGGHLVSINSIEEQEFLIKWITSYNKTRYSFWIDGTCQNDLKTFRDRNGNVVDFSRMRHDISNPFGSHCWLHLGNYNGWIVKNQKFWIEYSIIEWDK